MRYLQIEIAYADEVGEDEGIVMDKLMSILDAAANLSSYRIDITEVELSCPDDEIKELR